MGKIRTLRSFASYYDNWPTVATARLRGQNPTTYRVKRGPVLHGPADNDLEVIILEVFRRGDYSDPRIQPGPDDVVIDIGANVGAFSALIAPRCRQVYAYEAWPENVDYLRRNVAENGLTNVTVVGKALSDSDQPVRMYRSGASGGHLMFDKGGTLTEFLDVPAATLAGEIDRLGIERVGLLKLDCEGAEGVILGALPDSYLDRVDRIVMEYHDNVSPVPHSRLGERFRASGMQTETFLESPPYGYMLAWR